jgi:hypothetical protein
MAQATSSLLCDLYGEVALARTSEGLGGPNSIPSPLIIAGPHQGRSTKAGAHTMTTKPNMDAPGCTMVLAKHYRLASAFNGSPMLRSAVRRWPISKPIETR